MSNRREFILGFLTISALGGVYPALADPQFAINGDDGSPVENFKMPVELDPAQLAGVVWKGAKTADIAIYEFFDYNCGYCRKAAYELDALLAHDPGLRLGLVNNPILSLGSVQVAKIQQAILRLNGPDAAYAFHMKMFERHGQATGPAALDVVRAMKLDAHKIEEAADSSVVADVLSRQAHLASNAGMAMTPSFVLAGTGIMGWPGKQSLQDMIVAARKCDHPACK